MLIEMGWALVMAEMVMGIGGTVVELDEGINGDGNRDRERPRLRGGLR